MECNGNKHGNDYKNKYGIALKRNENSCVVFIVEEMLGGGTRKGVEERNKKWKQKMNIFGGWNEDEKFMGLVGEMK